MTVLAASDVVVSMIVRRRNNGRNYFKVKVAFGDGSKTYPAGGIPISKKAFGCPNDLESIDFFDLGTAGYSVSYDFTNQVLRLFQGGSHTHNLLLKNGAVADGATTRVNAGTNLLGANAGSDITVAGGGANGGVVAGSSGAGAEFTTGNAVPAVTLRAEIIGW